MNADEISSARAALLEVAERLRQHSQRQTTAGTSARESSLHSEGSSSSTLTSTPSTSHTNAAINVPSSSMGGNMHVEEHRRLFGYRAKGNKKWQGGKGKVTAKRQSGQTCTLKFVCLASCNPSRPPTSVKERAALSNAGLGDASITFDINGDGSHFHKNILETFPKLAESGYNLSLYDRAGDNSSFCVLKHPYLPRKLKEVAGQCKIYIKPLQKDLLESDDEVEIENDAGPVISCVTCNAMIPMASIEQHHMLVHESEPQTKRKKETHCIMNMLQKNDTGETSSSYEVKKTLQDLVPEASSDDIDSALSSAGGDVDAAAQYLLDGLTDNEIIASMDEPPEDFTERLNENRTVQPSNLQHFRENTIDESLPRQRFSVSREDGMEDLKKDILGCYKNPKVMLTAKPRVKFEGEEGVGSGPVREFLLCAMKIVEDGIERYGKPVLFFEGEDDHKIPVHDHALRCTGAFLAIGRIIGHSILHAGPLLYGISPSVLQYWALSANGEVNDLSLESLMLGLKDISDIDLREFITQIENLQQDEPAGDNLKNGIMPYIFEAGLDIGMINGDRKLLVQGLIVYFVTHKRKRELDDIAKGMNEVHLHDFMGKCGIDVVESIFPRCEMRRITAQQVKEAIVFEEPTGREDIIVYLYEYLSELEKYEEGKPSMNDLCCFWTAMNSLPPRNCTLLVKFQQSQNPLPMSETCFCSISLPTVHQSYEKFKRNMDIALTHGCLGIYHS